MVDQTLSQFPIRPNTGSRTERVFKRVCALTRMIEKLADLSPEEDSVRRFILNAYPQLGRAPKRQEVTSAFPQYAGEQLDRICRRLHEEDIVYIPEGSDEIAGAYPFTDLRDDHLVRFQWQKEQRSVYAMCAIDALGIPFMLETDAEIQSSCAHCKAEIKLSVRDEAIVTAEPPATVVFVGMSCAGSAATSLCLTLLFFCCEAHAETWREAHEQPEGEALTLGEALAVGKELFGDRMQSSDFWKQKQRTQ